MVVRGVTPNVSKCTQTLPQLNSNNPSKGALNSNIKKTQENFSIPNLTLNDLAKQILFRYGSFSAFAKKLGVTRQRTYQIFHGIDMPRTPESIQKIADLLDFNAVLLSQIFSKYSKKNIEARGVENKMADEYSNLGFQADMNSTKNYPEVDYTKEDLIREEKEQRKLLEEMN